MISVQDSGSFQLFEVAKPHIEDDIRALLTIISPNLIYEDLVNFYISLPPRYAHHLQLKLYHFIRASTVDVEFAT